MYPKSIVLHVPHASPVFPFGPSGWDEGIHLEIVRWTDWFTDWLFASASRLDHRIVPIVYPFSRFFCDVERLEDDPLEEIGQGTVYRRFGALERTIHESELEFALLSYREHRQRLIRALTLNTLLIDCHSFPADLSETDICIGINDDWSRPDDSLVDKTVSHFLAKGYSVKVNDPYSNSISPETGFRYRSLMIEVNKRTYLQGDRDLDLAKACALRRSIDDYLMEILAMRFTFRF